MTKNEFLSALYAALSPLTPEERNRSLAYYEEVIDDKLEEGEAESKIIADFGPIQDIAKEILGDTPTYQVPIKQGSKALPLTLIIVGSPLWFPLLLAGIVVLLAMYVVVWALIISFFAGCNFAACLRACWHWRTDFQYNHQYGGGLCRTRRWVYMCRVRPVVIIPLHSIRQMAYAKHNSVWEIRLV